MSLSQCFMTRGIYKGIRDVRTELSLKYLPTPNLGNYT